MKRLLVLIAFIALPLSAAPSFPSAADFVILHGKVSIGTVGDRMIGVIVDAPGDKYRHLFRLWTEGPVQAFHADAGAASIEYRGTELVVMGADQQIFYVLTTKTREDMLRIPEGFTGATYRGYGLNHEIRNAATRTTGRPGGVTNTLEECDFDCTLDKDYDAGGSGGGLACDAGGYGSSSCSISNQYGACSTNCTIGYSCCSAATANSNAYCRCRG